MGKEHAYYVSIGITSKKQQVIGSTRCYPVKRSRIGTRNYLIGAGVFHFYEILRDDSFDVHWDQGKNLFERDDFEINA